MDFEFKPQIVDFIEGKTVEEVINERCRDGCPADFKFGEAYIENSELYEALESKVYKIKSIFKKYENELEYTLAKYWELDANGTYNLKESYPGVPE